MRPLMVAVQGLGFFEVPVGKGMAATKLSEFRQLLDLQAP